MRPASVFLMALLLAAAVRGADLTAVVSQVEGNVTVKEEAPRRRSGEASPPIRQARFLQIVRGGDEIRVPAEAGAGLVCSNDYWIVLTPGMENRLTPDLCLKGKPLPPGTYKKLAPVGGRFQSLEGAFVLERNTRAPADELFGAPILLSPRNTSLLEARPEIVWTPVQEAIEYEIHVTGSSRFRVRLDASETPCNRNGDDWGEGNVCSLPWPASLPDLSYGETALLSVGARLGLASPLRAESEPSRIQRLTEERTEEVRSNLEILKNLPLACEARQLLEADLYARAEVLPEAISAYRKALARKEAPESRITLGDSYLATGLLRSADRQYRSALESSQDPGVHAAAELGLGKLESVRRNPARAAEHFKKARELYDLLGLKAEAEAVSRALEEALRLHAR